MELTPRLYQYLVRPSWWTKRYIHDTIQRYFTLHNKAVLDFGSGVGSNCCLVTPETYVGIDICPERVRFASRMYPEYRFYHFEGGRLPTPSMYFDYILVVAVLHHIPTLELCEHIKEFRRTLKPDGIIVIMEPCLSETSLVTNWFMKNFDKGQYIRNEQEYLELFHSHRFETDVLSRFRKLFLYNELFFIAKPKC